MRTMAQSLEARLVEALKSVDAFGDVSSSNIHDPMTVALRQKAVVSDLIRWDDYRARFVLTGSGRSRIAARNRPAGSVVHFRPREDKAGRGPLRKA